MSSFKFTNLFGSVYSKGNIIFSNDGKCILSPIGNRVVVYDLKSNHSFAIETLNRKDVEYIALSPDDSMLASVDNEGHCVFSNLNTRTPVHFINFKNKVSQINYSPCSKYIAVAIDETLKIFNSPSNMPKFRPFVLIKTFKSLNDKINCFSWSFDSSFIVAGCRDGAIRICPLDNDEKVILIKNNKYPLISVSFIHNSLDIFAIDHSASFSRFSHSEHFWKKTPRVSLRVGNCRLFSCSYEKTSGILALGFDSGVFSLYDILTLEKIQQITLCNDRINTIALSSSCNWVAFGIANSVNNNSNNNSVNFKGNFCAPGSGQLVVWEYNTESFILKQRGHHFDLTSVDFSPDGMFVVSGSNDGSIRVWDVNTGFSIVTFLEHKSKISSVKFSNSGQFIISSSFDGTCRTFDLNRYRNFRTLVAPTSVQFSCVTIDCSDELVCGCAVDDFGIYIWSLMTGRLLETLSGHSSVVSHLSFLPNSSKLISCSWDKSVRVWDVLETTKQITISNFNSDCVYLAVHPFRNLVAVLTIRAHIIFWEHDKDEILATVEGVSDLGLSRGVNDTLRSENSLKFKFFSAAKFSPDGEILVACGKSKYICIYDAQTFILRCRIQSTHNQSLDNILARLNSSKMTEAGSVHGLENVDSEDEDFHREKSSIKIPGSLKSDISLRKTKPEIALHDVSFCPTGRSFIIVSTEGLLFYSKDEKLFFNPTNLTADITSEYVLDLLKEKAVSKALLASVSIGDPELIAKCLESVAFEDIEFIAKSLPLFTCLKVLMVISEMLDNNSKHIEFYLKWSNAILISHGLNLKNQSFFEANKMLPMIRKIQKAMHNYQQGLGKM